MRSDTRAMRIHPCRFRRRATRLGNVRMKYTASIAGVFAVGCGSLTTSETRTVAVATNANTRASSQQVRPKITAEGECVTVELVENGVAKGAICAADAQAKGLTIV